MYAWLLVLPIDHWESLMKTPIRNLKHAQPLLSLRSVFYGQSALPHPIATRQVRVHKDCRWNPLEVLEACYCFSESLQSLQAMWDVLGERSPKAEVELSTWLQRSLQQEWSCLGVFWNVLSSGAEDVAQWKKSALMTFLLWWRHHDQGNLWKEEGIGGLWFQSMGPWPLWWEAWQH